MMRYMMVLLVILGNCLAASGPTGNSEIVAVDYPENILVTSEGIFILENGQVARASQLCCTEEGLIAVVDHVEGEVLEDTVIVQAHYTRCLVCKKGWQTGWGCTNPECPTRRGR